MARPVSPIPPALDLLFEQLTILPATGGAVQDLELPDVDELEDMLGNREVGDITAFLETPEPSLHHLYRPRPPLFRGDNHLYRFFIDGSLRTYSLGAAFEGNRSFPVELAQIGAALMQRDNRGKVTPMPRVSYTGWMFTL